MNGFYKVRKLKEALKLFKQMTDSGQIPDIIIYTILMDGIYKEGTLQKANRLLDEILKIVWNCNYDIFINNSLCKHIAEMHLVKFSNRCELQLGMFGGDFGNNWLGRIFETGKDSNLFLLLEVE